MTLTRDQKFIRRCFELAKKGTGSVSPNPLVGAVITDDQGNVISEGYHGELGPDHAELVAIKKAQRDLGGLTLYCNLEPCCHTHKKTPPCAQRIVKEGIKRVVISNLDPNPQVAGRGVELLKNHGITVDTQIFEEEGSELNEIFFYHIQHQETFVTLKSAQTLDGFIALKNGQSKWISCPESRLHTHHLRDQHDAIIAGRNTLESDDPALTVRIEEKPIYAPKRLVITLNPQTLSPNYKVFQDDYSEGTLIITSHQQQKNTKHLRAKVLGISQLSDKALDLNELKKKLYQEFQMTSLFVEGGSHLHTSFIQQRAFQKLYLYLSPKIMGHGTPSFQDLHLQEIKDLVTFDQVSWNVIGSDMLFSARRKD